MGNIHDRVSNFQKMSLVKNGSRTTAPNPKTSPNRNPNPNQREPFSSWSIVWWTPNPKTKPNLDPNPHPNWG